MLCALAARPWEDETGSEMRQVGKWVPRFSQASCGNSSALLKSIPGDADDALHRDRIREASVASLSIA